MSKLNCGAFFLVIIFAIGLTAAIGVGISQGWAIFSQPERGAIFNAEAYNENAVGDNAADALGADLYIRVVSPSSTDELRQLKFELTRTNLQFRDTREDVVITQACIDQVIFSLAPTRLDLSPTEASNYTTTQFNTDDICVTPKEDNLYSEYNFGLIAFEDVYEVTSTFEANPLTVILEDKSDISLNFWYPYDAIKIDPVIQVRYTLWDNNDYIAGGTLRPYLVWDYVTSGSRLWDIKLTTEGVDFGPDYDAEHPVYYSGRGERIFLSLQRPLMYRLVFPFFMIGMVLLISLVPLLGERDTLVDITAALLFGIFGLKGIIGPGDALGQTILDIGLISLYVLLAFAALLFFITKIRNRQRGTGG